MDRVGGVLVGGGRWACANRARGRRGLVKNLGGVTQLVDEVPSTLTRIPLRKMLDHLNQMTNYNPILTLI